VRSGDVAKLSPCLTKLVPMIQQAEIDYIKSPETTNNTLVQIAAKIPDGPPITAAANADAVTVMKQLKIVGNGSNNTLGDFDLSRVDQTISVLQPIFAAENVKVSAGLKSSDLVTNQFIDPNIHL
jgi:hypothetical protein